MLTYFNSQPHEEADVKLCLFRSAIHISTHSLTRRLTQDALNNNTLVLHFNSQPHEEADDSVGKVETQGDDISTHSLTRRLTFSRLTGYSLSGYFNSQPHEEADKKLQLQPGTRLAFQLTASRGG